MSLCLHISHVLSLQEKIATGPQNAFGALFQKTEAGLKKQRLVEDYQDSEMVPVKLEPGVVPILVDKPVKGINRKKLRRMPLEAEEIVTTLLYSETRQIINDEKRAQLNEERDNEIQRYYERVSEAKTFPILMEVMCIRAGYDYEPDKLVILNRSKQRIALYVRWIMDLWDFVVASPWFQSNPGYNFRMHAVSTMYLLKFGLVLPGSKICVLPADR